jgi:hypothetical protein
VGFLEQSLGCRDDVALELGSMRWAIFRFAREPHEFPQSRFKRRDPACHVPPDLSGANRRLNGSARDPLDPHPSDQPASSVLIHGRITKPSENVIEKVVDGFRVRRTSRTRQTDQLIGRIRIKLFSSPGDRVCRVDEIERTESRQSPGTF